MQVLFLSYYCNLVKYTITNICNIIPFNPLNSHHAIFVGKPCTHHVLFTTWRQTNTWAPMPFVCVPEHAKWEEEIHCCCISKWTTACRKVAEAAHSSHTGHPAARGGPSTWHCCHCSISCWDCCQQGVGSICRQGVLSAPSPATSATDSGVLLSTPLIPATPAPQLAPDPSTGEVPTFLTEAVPQEVAETAVNALLYSMAWVSITLLFPIPPHTLSQPP